MKLNVSTTYQDLEKMGIEYTYCINDINVDTAEMTKWTYSTLEEAVEGVKEWIEYYSYKWDDADIYAELDGEYAKYDNASDYAKDNVVIFKWDKVQDYSLLKIYDYEGNIIY